jgi:hypothetical protein
MRSTPREHAIEILEYLNFDASRCTDWIEGIAGLIRARDLEEPDGLSQLKQAIHTAKKAQRIMTQDRAYRAYGNYAKTHRATTANPLRTFSGWLQQMNVQIVEEQSK